MEFTTEQKKELNEFIDKYEYLLEEGDYVTFLKKYREQNKNVLDEALYYAFVDLVKDNFGLNIEWFIKNDPDFYWLNYFESGSSIPHINIPAGTTKITDSAFTTNDTITSVTIGDSVTTIGHRAFYGCSKLTTVKIGENSQLNTIGYEAFFGCSSLTSIYIPNSVTTIRSGAFSNCSSLTSIIIPDSINYIGFSAFSGCDNLTIYCEATSKPKGWAYDWNSSKRPVMWGYKKK